MLAAAPPTGQRMVQKEDAAETRYVKAGGRAGFLLARTSDCNGSVPSAFSSVVRTKLGMYIRRHMCAGQDALSRVHRCITGFTNPGALEACILNAIRLWRCNMRAHSILHAEALDADIDSSNDNYFEQLRL